MCHDRMSWTPLHCSVSHAGVHRLRPVCFPQCANFWNQSCISSGENMHWPFGPRRKLYEQTAITPLDRRVGCCASQSKRSLSLVGLKKPSNMCTGFAVFRPTMMFLVVENRCLIGYLKANAFHRVSSRCFINFGGI